jgi:hypothetical protein
MAVSHRPFGMPRLLAAAALLVGFAQPARAAGIPLNVIIRLLGPGSRHSSIAKRDTV